MSLSFFYTTINSETTGRASYFFRSKDNAEKRCSEQNARAKNIGIKTRYSVVERSGEGIEYKDIRD